MSTRKYFRKTVKITFRILSWLLLFLFIIILSVYLLLQTNRGNQLLKDWTVSWLQKKFNTEFAVDRMRLHGLHGIDIYGLSLKDRQHMGIVSFDTLSADVNLADLMANKISIPNIQISGLTANITRNSDNSTFNYQFILDAFGGGSDEKDNTGTAWDIAFQKVDLSRISFKYDDRQGGTYYRAGFSSLKTELKTTDLEHLRFIAEDLLLDSLDAEIRLSPEKPGNTSPEVKTKSTSFDLQAGNIRITNTRFRMDNPADSLHVEALADLLTVTGIRYDGMHSMITGKMFNLQGHETLVTYRSGNKKTPEPAASIKTSLPFSIRLDSLSLVNNGIKVRDQDYLKAPKDRFDTRRMEFDSLQVQASAIRYDSVGYGANIRQFSFRDQNGFVLRELRADAFYSDTALRINNLALESRHTRLKGSVAMQYLSAAKMISAPAQTRINAGIQLNTFRLDDWTYFAPQLKKNAQLEKILKKDIYTDILASGTLERLTLGSFLVKTEGNLVKGSATLMHPTDPGKISGSLKLDELTTSRQDLRSLLPGGLIPDSVWRYIPEKLTVRGTLDGSAQSFRPDLALQTSFGNLSVKGFLDQPADKINARYDLTLHSGGLALDRILGDTSLGLVAGEFHVKGQGYDPEKIRADIKANVQEARYNGYIYHDIQLEGNADHGRVSANLASQDPNVDLDGDISFLYNKKLGDVNIRADIRNLDLRALGFMDSTFTARGRINIDFPVLDSARLEGKGMISDLALHFGKNTVHLDTISVNAFTKLDSQFVRLRSPFADAEIFGIFSLQAIPVTVRTIVDNWLVTSGETKPFPAPMYLEFRGNVHLSDSLAPVIPGLRKISPFGFEGAADTKTNLLAFQSKIAMLEYRNYHFDSIYLGLMENAAVERFTKARFLVQFQDMKSSSFQMNRLRFTGQIDKGEVKSALLINDRFNKPRYIIPVTYVNDPERPYVSLRDTILMNKTRWQVNPENRIYVDPERLSGSNLHLYSGNESITLQSATVHPNGMPLALAFHDFHLETLSDMLISDTSLLKGVVNGNFTMLDMSPFHFSSDIRIDDLNIFGSPYGNLYTKASTRDDGYYDADVSLTGAGNDVSVKGNYQAGTGKLDFNLHMAPFSLSPLGPFLDQYVDSLKGGLRGDIRVQGTVDEPLFYGSLRLDSTSVIAKQTGTPVHILATGFDFDGREILFQGMNFTDSAGNPASLTGTVRSETLTTFNYDLRLETKKFLVAGHKRYPEQLVSGPAYAAINMTMKGDEQAANVDGNINILDNSLVTYVYTSEKEAKNGEGLIEFFDPAKKPVTDSLATAKETVKRPKFQLSLNSYLAVTPKTKISIVLDEYSGDHVEVKGTANLIFAMDPTGQMELTGNYEIESGKYDLSIGGLIDREFAVEKGSTISWTGDPMKADINLTALYKVKTDAEELVHDIQTVPGISKQKFNFLVYLQLKGQIMKPGISFRIDMQEDEQEAFDGVVYTRIRQVNNVPSELNKQVMSLLALNSFMSENPFNSMAGSGGNFQTEVFSTAGKMLTQELNNFIGDMVHDVDIDVGLDIRDDYSNGKAQRRSDLKVGVTRSFANNRLTVYVGNTFALENGNQQNALSGLAGDVSLEYLLTRDGKYRMRAYSVTKEDLTFNGMVTETGATFVVVLEFNRLKNAFRSNKRKNGNP